MPEISRPPEGLNVTVKKSCVENYTERGYTPSDPDVGKKILYTGSASNALELTPPFPNQQQKEEGWTRVGFVPFSSDVFKDRPEGVSKDDVAVLFGYEGDKVDRYSRSGGMRAAAVMSSADAARFAEAIKKDPTLVYTFLNMLNGGPIKMYDGSPMKIKPGKAIEILANTKVGGQQKETIMTSQFPPDYKPNVTGDSQPKPEAPSVQKPPVVEPPKPEQRPVTPDIPVTPLVAAHAEQKPTIPKLPEKSKAETPGARKETPLEAIENAKSATEARMVLLENDGLKKPELLAAVAKRFFAEKNETEGNRYVDMASQRIKEEREAKNAKDLAEVADFMEKTNAQLKLKLEEINAVANKLNKASFR